MVKIREYFKLSFIKSLSLEFFTDNKVIDYFCNFFAITLNVDTSAFKKIYENF